MVYNEIVNIIKKGGESVRKDTNYCKNPSILNDFIDYSYNSRNLSIRTIESYTNDLNIFLKFMVIYKELKIKFEDISTFELLNVTCNDVIAFLVYSNYYRTNCATTRQRRLSAIRTFYNWLLKTNLQIQKENPTNTIPNIEKCLQLPKHLTLNQAKKIQTIFNIKNSRNPTRNNTIITLFLSTGMRASELISININDINFNNNSITIKGKRNRQRKVYFSNYCKKQLNKYLDIRERERKIIDKDALFINSQHKRIGIDAVEDICSKAYRLMGLEMYGYTTHTLRHTAATIMYKENQDILLIKEFLGHQSITSTYIYTHIYNSEVKQAVDNNPLNS